MSPNIHNYYELCFFINDYFYIPEIQTDIVVTCDAGTQYSLYDIFVDIQLEPPCLISAPKKTPGDDVPLAEPPLPSPSILLSPLKPSIDYKPSDLSVLDAAEEANDEESSDEELVLLCTFFGFLFL